MLSPKNLGSIEKALWSSGSTQHLSARVLPSVDVASFDVIA